jgi:hypothetical protein
LLIFNSRSSGSSTIYERVNVKSLSRYLNRPAHVYDRRSVKTGSWLRLLTKSALIGRPKLSGRLLLTESS